MESEELRVVEIRCRICKFRNKVYPPYSSDYEFKPSSTPCPGKGYQAELKCLGCFQSNRIYWCLSSNLGLSIYPSILFYFPSALPIVPNGLAVIFNLLV